MPVISSLNTPAHKTPLIALFDNSLCLESSWETSHVVGKGSVLGQELNVSTIHEHLSGSLLLHVLLTTEWCETPVLGHNDLLATWELVLRSSESLESDGTV